MRRLKYVPSREVSGTEVQLYEARPIPAPPATISPVIEELKDPDSPPAIDPSEIGAYRAEHRPRRRRFRYRFAQLFTAAALLLTAGAVIAVIFSDEMVAKVFIVGSVLFGFVAVSLALRSRMASRILGYAIAVAALSAITAIIILTLPKDWFEEHHPERIPHTEYRAPRPQI